MLHGHKLRLQGIEFVSKLVDAIIKEIAKKLGAGLEGLPSTAQSRRLIGEKKRSPRPEEAELLGCVSKLIKLGLADEILLE